MAPTSSSTRKAARLAQKGKGKRVRFQGGTLFPAVVAAVLVLGMALIVYARTSRPAADASPPQPGLDHWHAAYGFQICSDTPTIQLSGTLEDVDTNGQFVSTRFRTTGVHSHDDGVIHWHPYSSRASGRNAKLGVFLDNYEVDITNDTLRLPDGDGAFTIEGAAPPEDFPTTYEEGETDCAGEDAALRVVAWADYTDPGSERVYTSNFEDVPFDGDGLVIVIAFVPDDVDVEMPSWAPRLPELGAADSGVVPETLAPGETAPEGTADDTTEGTETDATDPDATDAESDSESEATDGASDNEGPDTTEG